MKNKSCECNKRPKIDNTKNLLLNINLLDTISQLIKMSMIWRCKTDNYTALITKIHPKGYKVLRFAEYYPYRV